MATLAQLSCPVGEFPPLDFPLPEADSSNEFSHANVFGMFLTLIFCLLSQPLGSLVHWAGVPGWWRTLVLSCWRLNPLSCVAEALLITFVMSRAAWQLVQEGHGPHFRRLFARHSQVLNGREWRTRFQRMAAALLLLRSQERTMDGSPMVAKLFEAVEMEVYSKRWNIVSDKGAQDDGTSGSTFATGPDNSQSTAAAEQSFHGNNESRSHPNLETHRGTNDPINSESGQGTTRRRTGIRSSPPATSLPHSSTSPDTANTATSLLEQHRAARPDTRSARLKEALGSNALAHSEIFVHLVSLSSMAIVVLKLAATTLLPWKVVLPAYFMISGWVAVQALLVLLHSQELSEIDMAEAARIAWDIDREIWAGTNGTPWARLVVLGVVQIPLMAYFATWLTMYRGDLLRWHSIVAFIIEAILGIPLLLVIQSRTSPHFWMIFIPVGCCLFYLEILFFSSTALFLIRVYWWLFDAFVLYCLSLGPTLGSWEMEQDSLTPQWALLNIAFTILLFIAMFELYEPSGTYKPEWLDWLG